MSLDRSRRAFLRGSGVAVLAGIAGCSFGTEEGTSGGPGGSNTTTSPAGRTYTITVTNNIEQEDLAAMPHVERSAKAELHVEAARSVEGKEDPNLFEKRVELAPGTSRTFENAFETKTSGDAYVVTCEVTPLVEAKLGDLFDKYRFRPGQFNTPSDDVIEVGVTDDREGKFLRTTVRVTDSLSGG